MKSEAEIRERIRVCRERIINSDDPEERAAYHMEVVVLRWVLGTLG